jgi:NADPH:quinone reductase-like Zn-dependent oxidoreductase
VFGITAGGGQATEIVVAASHCAPVPDTLDLRAAGGVPEVFLTAHDALRTQAAVQPGERILVHAVGSGVGTAVIQLARAWGCPSVGTARTEDKLRRAEALGLGTSVLAPPEFAPSEFAAAITEAAGGPIDVTADLVGGAYVATDVLAAAPRGRVVLIGTLAGGRTDLPILAVMSKRLTLHGTVLRPRSREEKAAATAAFAAEVVPLLADGRVAPVVERIVPLDEAESAYALLASDATFGKVILDCA